MRGRVLLACLAFNVASGLRAAAGLRFGKDEDIAVRKKWRILTSNSELVENLKPLSKEPDDLNYVHVAGKITKET